MSSPEAEDLKAEINQFISDFAQMRVEIGQMIVGYEDIVERVLLCLLASGNVLLEDVPGLGKTMLVRCLSEVLHLNFSRIQFTPDLMPADIVGTNVVMDDASGRRVLQFQPGPIFTHLLLADEINRATPRTQSALLESMQEHSVTVGGVTHVLEEPYFVMATQNPIEQEGTYPLPEAELDKFMFKLVVPFPGFDELKEIIRRTTREDIPELSIVTEREKILQMRQLVRKMPVAEHVERYAGRMVLATHPDTEFATEMVKQYVRTGSSPRGIQALLLGGKIRALLQGRYHVACEDIQDIALPSLRHRMTMTFEGESENMTTDQIVENLLEELEEFAEVESSAVT